MYKVIKRFHDLQDVKKTKSGDVYHEYKEGDTYPRKGLSPSDDRIAELAGSKNRQNTPLIQLVEEEATEKKLAAKKAAAKKDEEKTSVE